MVTIEEKLTLMELIAGYCLASDNKDVQAHIAYYAEEGYITGGMTTSPKKDAMAEELAEIFAMEGTLKRHLAMNHQFKKVGNEIHVDYLLLVVEGEQLPEVIATAMTHDEFIQEKGTWKIKLHRNVIDPAMFNLMKKWEEEGKAALDFNEG
ncbi:MAG: nuclear transport factor 2 family protein [Thermonemataceae bacterium]